MRGLTFWIAFGKYGGFSIMFGDPTYFRVCLGWVSFVVVGIDVEAALELFMKEYKKNHG